MNSAPVSMSVSLTGLTLHVKDVDKSLAFYSKLPGVQVQVHRSGDFALLRLGEMRLGLLRHDTGAFHIELETENLDNLYEYLKSIDFPVSGPPTVKNWGERDFLVIDPDGNMVEFGAFGDHPTATNGGDWQKK